MRGKALHGGGTSLGWATANLEGRTSARQATLGDLSNKLSPEETVMSDTDDDAALERLAKKIFELQNPGKSWPPTAEADAEERRRYLTLAKSESDRG